MSRVKRLTPTNGMSQNPTANAESTLAIVEIAKMSPAARPTSFTLAVFKRMASGVTIPRRESGGATRMKAAAKTALRKPNGSTRVKSGVRIQGMSTIHAPAMAKR